MPRTPLPVTTVPTQYATTAQDVTWTPADVVNGNDFAANGRRLLLARNTGATPRNVTVQSRGIKPTNRVGNLGPDAIAAGATKVYPLFPLQGWQQADGKIWVNGDNAEVTFAVIDLR